MPIAANSASGFSTPLAVAAAGTAIAWLIALIIVLIARRPPRVHAVDQGMELPPEPPAVAGLLANDFVVPGEVAPAILLDLAARHIVDLEEVQPGKTICRLREHAPTEALTEYEQRVLAELRDKAIDGVVPTDALTTGPEEQSADWHHALAQEVVDDAQARGWRDLLARPARRRRPSVRDLVASVGVGGARRTPHDDPLHGAARVVDLGARARRPRRLVEPHHHGRDRARPSLPPVDRFEQRASLLVLPRR